MLHSSTHQGLQYSSGKQIGTKKTNYILSLPEISLCFEKNRKKRCKREPKCQYVDCLRNAWNSSQIFVIRLPKIFVIRLLKICHKIAQSCQKIMVKCHKTLINQAQKVKLDIILVLSRTNMVAIPINASVHISMKLSSVSENVC